MRKRRKLMLFANRADAGRRLAEQLSHLRGNDAVILALPRGGVPVAFEVAQQLDAPLDVIVVRKLGVPSQPELGMGAIGEGGVRIINQSVLTAAGVDAEQLAAVEQQERVELERRARAFRGDRPRVALEGRTAVIVDDGIATGSTARAACEVARAQGASRVVLAVPVAPSGWTSKLRDVADELIAVATPEPFWAIGQFYADFTQTTDAEVVASLEQAGSPPKPRTEPAKTTSGAVIVEAGDVHLEGTLRIPDGALGVVIFVHGSGSSRHSPRNRFVAETLNAAGLGTLLFDLLTTSEETSRSHVFDIDLLSERLFATAAWLRRQQGLGELPLGFFGASTGAAAALWTAARMGGDVAAVVSRGGRPDLAAPRLHEVVAPTLLIVGERDEVVIGLNQQAYDRLTCTRRFVVVPGATHLFAEPGALDEVAALARDWFVGAFGLKADLGT